MVRLNVLVASTLLCLGGCSAVDKRPVEVTRRSASPDATLCGNHCIEGRWGDYTKVTSSGGPAMKIDRWKYRIEGLAPDYNAIKLTDVLWVDRKADVSNFHFRYQLLDAGRNVLWDSGEMTVGGKCTAGPVQQTQSRTPQVSY